MTKYKIIEEKDITVLVKWVNLHLREGWELRGDLVIFNDSFVQVMTTEVKG